MQLVAFLFPYCTGFCPLIALHLVGLETALRGTGLANEVQFVAFNVDPKHTGPKQAAAFLTEYGWNPHDLRFQFLTGSPEATRRVVRGGYHVYWQPPSANAFRHIAMPGNISNNYTLLDHPLLNGHACAQVHVTQGAGGGVLNGHHVGVWYTGSRWAIYNQDLASMPIGAEFHVVVDARQVFECSDVIFADAFD